MAKTRHGAAPAAVTLAALIGVAIALFYYLAPLTGVTGTIGAMVVVGTSLLVALAGVVLWFRHSGALAGTVRVLGWLLALGTLFAAWLLHEFWLVAAMAVALVAASVDFTHRGAHR
jgi:quinoprotein glucose dehydrogenase